MPVNSADSHRAEFQTALHRFVSKQRPWHNSCPQVPSLNKVRRWLHESCIGKSQKQSAHVSAGKSDFTESAQPCGSSHEQNMSASPQRTKMFGFIKNLFNKPVEESSPSSPAPTAVSRPAAPQKAAPVSGRKPPVETKPEARQEIRQTGNGNGNSNTIYIPL